MKKIFAGICLLVASTSMAQVSYSMPALEVGFKWNSMDADGASSNKQKLGFQFGGSTVFNFHEKFGLRTGLFYSERPFKFDSSGDYEGKLTYAEVPVHFMFKIEDYAGIYLGPSIAIKMGDEVTCPAGITPCALTDTKGMIFPITLGAQFKFTPILGINLFFETVGSEVAKGLKNSRAIGANLMLTFD